MPRLDIYHDVVKRALEKDGWTITHDPYKLTAETRKLWIDLGAERLITAEQGTRKIAAETKSFLGKSDVNDLENAIGQYTLYLLLLEEQEPERELYLAIPEFVYNTIFSERIGQVLLERKRIRLLVFDRYKEEILQWIE